MKARTRLAPSPTGYIHIGTLRTALFDYFLARQTGGQFVVRIEDTDRERLVEGATESILATFVQLGIEHDEGPILGEGGKISQKGKFGPYVQSERLDIYKKYIDQLVGQGDAYPCFCSKERLDEMRAEQRATKQTPKYDRACLELSEEEKARKLDGGEAHVIRLKIPSGETAFDDIIRGTVKVKNSDIDDQVILKSDGFPTYHLAVVVDDQLMKISHVIRGEEWISSTPKHVILMKMLGFSAPKFAHVPLLLNPDKTKLSKRQGDVAVEDYLKRGYLPKALINFVATLGYNPKSDQELYELDELVKLFDLSKVNKSGAVMNIEKLDWMNNHYMRELSIDELAEAARAFVQANVDDNKIRRALKVEVERANRLDELQERIDPYLDQPGYDAAMLTWKKSDAGDAKQQLENLQVFIADMPDKAFKTPESIEKALREYIEKNDLDNGSVLWPLRVALSGLKKSASPFEFLWALGKEEGLERIKHSIKLFK